MVRLPSRTRWLLFARANVKSRTQILKLHGQNNQAAVEPANTGSVDSANRNLPPGHYLVANSYRSSGLSRGWLAIGKPARSDATELTQFACMYSRCSSIGRSTFILVN